MVRLLVVCVVLSVSVRRRHCDNYMQLQTKTLRGVKAGPESMDMHDNVEIQHVLRGSPAVFVLTPKVCNVAVPDDFVVCVYATSVEAANNTRASSFKHDILCCIFRNSHKFPRC